MRARVSVDGRDSLAGDIVHVKIFGKHVIMLNSARAVNDLLDKRSSIYSDRPHLPLIKLSVTVVVNDIPQLNSISQSGSGLQFRVHAIRETLVITATNIRISVW